MHSQFCFLKPAFQLCVISFPCPCSGPVRWVRTGSYELCFPNSTWPANLEATSKSQVYCQAQNSHEISNCVFLIFGVLAPSAGPGPQRVLGPRWLNWSEWKYKQISQNSLWSDRKTSSNQPEQNGNLLTQVTEMSTDTHDFRFDRIPGSSQYH